jgi:hypothetical protein
MWQAPAQGAHSASEWITAGPQGKIKNGEVQSSGTIRMQNNRTMTVALKYTAIPRT